MHLVQPPKFYITIVSNFPRYYSRPNRNRRQWLRKIGAEWGEVHYGLSENSELCFP